MLPASTRSLSSRRLITSKCTGAGLRPSGSRSSTTLTGSGPWLGLGPWTFAGPNAPYDEDYPLRLADYTDALWNRGVLDETKQTVCFKDSPFARTKLDGASLLCAGGQEYPILKVDDHDAGWLMVTLDIEDATVLWDQELTTK